MAATFLNQVERDYFVRKAGGGENTTKVTHLKRAYWGAFVGGSTPQTPIDQLEKQWLLKVISDAGATPTDSNSLETLWAQAVKTLGIVPSKFLNDNKILFYRNAP